MKIKAHRVEHAEFKNSTVGELVKAGWIIDEIAGRKVADQCGDCKGPIFVDEKHGIYNGDKQRLCRTCGKKYIESLAKDGE